MGIQSDWIGEQPGSVGQSLGPRMKGPLFLDPEGNLIMKDIATGLYYMVYIENGALTLEEVTL